MAVLDSLTVKLSRVEAAIGMTRNGTPASPSSAISRLPVDPPAGNSAVEQPPRTCTMRATLIPPPPGS
ncbi:Uncharacterised protein [Mycobacterium tuberculosis]|uniref:Uncharacterized protein n=1 Tax=Mycobacterium tuberculosis TaxID=1773 RepID=A0A916L9T4_MYCTX|nr:Uncharacterised protein [Mycobacterium tuberculosis]